MKIKTNLKSIWITQIIALIVFMLIITKCTAQDNITLSITQDLGLAVRDDTHGNKAFTPDFILKIRFNGYQKLEKNNPLSGYMHMGAIYEFADLSGGDYTRYGAEIGYTFTEIYLFNLNLNITPFINYGFLDRNTPQGKFSVTALELGGDLTLPLTSWTALKISTTLSQAKDLKVMWGVNKWRKNVAVGVLINLTKN